MVEVPDTLIAKHVVELANEHGEFIKLDDTAHEGEYGQYEHETDWDLLDLVDNDPDVFMDDTSIVIEGEIEGHYSVKTQSATYYPNSKAHPAEYENREITLYATVSLELEELSIPEISITPY